MRRGPIGLAVVAALAFGGISLAVAASGPREQVGDLTVVKRTTNGATVKCPNGQHVMSGGYVQTGGPQDLLMQGNRPTDNGRGWSTALFNNSFDNDHFVRSFAVCSSLKTRVATTTFPIGSGDFGEKSISCRRGERAVGGGIYPTVAGAQFFFVRASGPLNSSGSAVNTDDGDKPMQWYAAIVNSLDSSQQATLYVVCAPNSKAIIESSEFTLNQGQEGEAHVFCRGGRTAIGGGIVQLGSPSNLQVRASGPLSTGFVEDERDGRRPIEWYSAAANLNAGPGHIFRAMAICE